MSIGLASAADFLTGLDWLQKPSVDLLFTLTMIGVATCSLLLSSSQFLAFVERFIRLAINTSMQLGLVLAKVFSWLLRTLDLHRSRFDITSRGIVNFSILAATMLFLIYIHKHFVSPQTFMLTSLVAVSIFTLLNISVFIATFAVLALDYRSLNGLRTYTKDELDRARPVTNRAFLIVASIILIISMSFVLERADAMRPGTVLAKPVGSNFVWLDYLIATIRALPFGGVILSVTDLSRKVTFSYWSGEAISSGIFLIGSSLLIGSITFAVRMHAEARVLVGRLLDADSMEYQYLADRVARYPGYVKAYLTEQISDRAEQITFDLAFKLFVALDVGVGPQSLVYNLRKWKGGVASGQIVSLNESLMRSENLPKFLDSWQKLISSAAFQIGEASETNKELRRALLQLMLFSIQNASQRYDIDINSLINARMTKASLLTCRDDLMEGKAQLLLAVPQPLQEEIYKAIDVRGYPMHVLNGITRQKGVGIVSDLENVTILLRDGLIKPTEKQFVALIRAIDYHKNNSVSGAGTDYKELRRALNALRKSVDNLRGIKRSH